MTARAALRAAWAGHGLLSPLAIMLLFKNFKEHFYAEASPGSMRDPLFESGRLSPESAPEGCSPSEKTEKAKSSRVVRNK